MSAGYIRSLITPEQIEDARWSMAAHRHLCLGPEAGKHLSGGSMLASVVSVLEGAIRRPLIQAHAQFLAAAKADAAYDIVIVSRQDGRSITQVMVEIRQDQRVLAYISAALGARQGTEKVVWETYPQSPAPEDCVRVPFVREGSGDLHSFLDMRLAFDPRFAPQGRAQFWVRTESDLPIDAAFIVQIADYLPEALHLNLGRPVGATSLDNMIRIIAKEATPWLLCDIQLSAIHDGLFHGAMTIYSQLGCLLALANQSGVVQRI
jgi:acyl-CoA thioesterase II